MGYHAYFFGNINFEIEVVPQGPYMYQHFGEVSGPRRPTGSKPRPALIWAPGIAIYMAIPGAHIRVGRGSELVGRRGPETSPKCWYMYGPCWATSISKLMFPKKYAWYPHP